MGGLPRGVARRILTVYARDGVVVVTGTGPRPSRVFRMDKYLKMQELGRKRARVAKPSSSRKGAAKKEYPWGPVPGTVRRPIRRRDFYD